MNSAMATPAQLVIKAFELLGPAATVDRIQDEVQPLISSPGRIVDAYPSTPLQEGLMALSMKNRALFVPQNPYRLPASVDLEKFKKAWQMTVDFNAILRTRIVQTSPFGLIQVVLDQQPIEWVMSDNLEDYLKRDRQARVGFGSILLRYGIVDDATSGIKYFVWTLHHAVMDGWSARLLLNQVDQIYR